MNQTKLDGIEVLGDLRRVDLRERVTDGGRELALEINKLSLFDLCNEDTLSTERLKRDSHPL